MTAALAPTTNALTEQQLNLILQYTVEAYKTFAKLAPPECSMPWSTGKMDK